MQYACEKLKVIMPDQTCNYLPLTKQPKLFAVYVGWQGQRILTQTADAVLTNEQQQWELAAEVERLIVIVYVAEEGKGLLYPPDLHNLISVVSGCYGDSGWWGSTEASQQRCHDENEAYQRVRNCFPARAGSLPVGPTVGAKFKRPK